MTASSRPKTGLLSRWAGPAVPEPLILFRRETQHLAQSKILQIKLGQPLEGILNRLRNPMDVSTLLGHERKRIGEHAHGFGGLALVQINQMSAETFGTYIPDQLGHFRFWDFVERLANAAGQSQTAQARFFGRCQHRQPSWWRQNILC